MIRAFLPEGLSRYLNWKKRFEALGLDRTHSATAAISRPMMEALVTSRIEHLPPFQRLSLSTVVDVGANVGQWLSALLKFVAIDRIEAFEPNPEAFEILNARFGNRPNVRLHQLALGEKMDTLTLNVTRSSDLASLLVPGEVLRDQYSTGSADVVDQIPVNATTLDAMIDDDVIVDLLKIDVQGFERPVLRGARKTLGRTRIMLIEANLVSHYEGDDTFGSLCEYISKELAFEFWDLAQPYRGPSGRSLWTDAVFINPTIQPHA